MGEWQDEHPSDAERLAACPCRVVVIDVEPVGRATQSIYTEFPGSQFIFNLHTKPYLIAPERSDRFIPKELVEEYAHPKAGRLRQARPAARFSVTPAGIRHGAPALGEHTDAVLAETGYSPAEIAALRAAGAMGRAKGERA